MRAELWGDPTSANERLSLSVTFCKLAEELVNMVSIHQYLAIRLDILLCTSTIHAQGVIINAISGRRSDSRVADARCVHFA